MEAITITAAAVAHRHLVEAAAERFRVVGKAVAAETAAAAAKAAGASAANRLLATAVVVASWSLLITTTAAIVAAIGRGANGAKVALDERLHQVVVEDKLQLVRVDARVEINVENRLQLVVDEGLAAVHVGVDVRRCGAI